AADHNQSSSNHSIISLAEAQLRDRSSKCRDNPLPSVALLKVDWKPKLRIPQFLGHSMRVCVFIKQFFLYVPIIILKNKSRYEFPIAISCSAIKMSLLLKEWICSLLTI